MSEPSQPGPSSDPRVLTLVTRVIRDSSRERPADATLRAALKAEHGLSRAQGSWISRALFAYYRWLGWLEKQNSLEKQVQEALQLAERFVRQPTSFPHEEWVTRAVPSWLSAEMKVTPAWARSLQAEPRLWLRARRGQGRILARALGDCHVFGPPPLAEILEYRGHEDLFRTPEFHAGQFELQDISSQAVGLICAPQASETWWDACCGEGGKLLHVSDLMENRGLIWATDRALWRLRLLKRRAARAKAFNYRATAWDGGARLPVRTKFDGVLVDAPCSGVGTWQRNPQARWTTTPDDISELADLQARILTHAAAALKPGGRLVYAVCTLTKSETTGVVTAFQERCPEFEPMPVGNPLEPTAPPEPCWHLHPETFGGNGMFVAVWRRRPAAAPSQDQ